MEKFKYQKSFKIIHWGCSFDSLLELKFAISIQKDYEFLRSRISIYYDPQTRRPTNYIRYCTRRYTPDFLIRHKQTGKAYWIEIKPRAFAKNFTQLNLRKEIAENYIRWKKYDWIYKVVYDDEIIFTPDQRREFEQYCQAKSKSAFKLQFEKYNKRFDRSAPSLFSPILSNSRIRFVMFGNSTETFK